MKPRPRHILYAAIAAPLAALVVVWLGVVGVGAASGHWAVTEWFLHFAMRSSVRTAALGESAPPPPTDALRPAAGHFATGCAPCHGAPGIPRPPSVQAMLPAPPDLASVVGTWSDAELHRIVMHGVRFTGMPAWPDPAREDEGWMMVAFLRALPDLDPRHYAEFVARPGAPPEDALPAACAGCHGWTGRDGGARVPVLAGQSEAYLRASLDAYARGARASGVMRQAVAGLSAEDRAALARMLAAFPPGEAAPATTIAATRPPTIATHGRPETGVPACLSCHGRPGQAGAPRLEGQPADYLAGQLRLFRDGARGGGSYSGLMTQAASGLEDDEINAVSAWFAGRAASD